MPARVPDWPGPFGTSVAFRDGNWAIAGMDGSDNSVFFRSVAGRWEKISQLGPSRPAWSAAASTASPYVNVARWKSSSAARPSAPRPSSGARLAVLVGERHRPKSESPERFAHAPPHSPAGVVIDRFIPTRTVGKDMDVKVVGAVQHKTTAIVS